MRFPLFLLQLIFLVHIVIFFILGFNVGFNFAHSIFFGGVFNCAHFVPAIWQERFPLFLQQFILGKEDQQMLRSLYQFITKKSKQITFIGYKIVVADFLFSYLIFQQQIRDFHIFFIFRFSSRSHVYLRDKQTRLSQNAGNKIEG